MISEQGTDELYMCCIGLFVCARVGQFPVLLVLFLWAEKGSTCAPRGIVDGCCQHLIHIIPTEDNKCSSYNLI